MLEQFREEIAKRLVEQGFYQKPYYVSITHQNMADQILSIKLGSHTLKEIIKMIDEGKLVKESKDQNLPDIPETLRDSLGYFKFIKGEPVQRVYTEAQQDMLNTGFKKVEPL